MSKDADAICRAFRATSHPVPPRGEHVFPDQLAPVIRNGSAGRELTTMRWGFPPPPGATTPVINVRHPGTAFWHPWTTAAHRCLIPADMFREHAKPEKPGDPALPRWFALDEDRPLFAFAGLWRPWTGSRGPKGREQTGDHLLYVVMKCAPNGLVAPVQPKAMPVMLTTDAEFDTWLNAPAAEALALQRPLPPELMREIAYAPAPTRPKPALAQGSLF